MISNVMSSAIIRSTAVAAVVLAAWGVAGGEAIAAPAAAPEVQRFDNWSVSCTKGANNQAASCTMFQELMQQGNPPRRIARLDILRPIDAQKVEARLIMPLGLELASGVQTQVDNQAATPTGAAFYGCFPDGCLIPVTLNTSALSSGQIFKAVAVAAVSRQLVTVSFPLKGFAAAYKSLADKTRKTN
ncbi:Invasion protein IalB, involved in pathogenesis [Methylobacillus rhizosphaerae]|uniref:Invasion protein IalB, involved in pathogenesis n=1 Tax=Methylobacillus rhizosphaerae TaxID=551994 RepID=A0A238YB90_9PROT|nr:invasion associated locus B family protein [Methylobacillus rhizosphaerae]SNR68222.1 Invasion protein IalB, involved in pathogenesis [Methylobacillus rhizosphaerae]